MKAEIKQKWLEALRSGEYPKVYGWLHKGDAFCAIGVACDLVLKESGESWKQQREGSDIFEFDDLSAITPTEIIEWSGLESYECSQIMGLSDGSDTFDEVIAYIERIPTDEDRATQPAA